MLEAIAKSDSDEPVPTSPVTESHEVIMNSPENLSDAAAEDFADAKSSPVQEDLSPNSMKEELPPGVNWVADMPPPAHGPGTLAIQDIPQYVQDRLAEAEAAAGIAAPEEKYHDRRLCNNLQFPP